MRTWGLGEDRPALILKQVIEVGRVWLADYTSEFRMFLDVSVEQVQDPDTRPFAIFPASKAAWAIANLTAALISEAYPTGDIDLPTWFNDDLRYAADIIADAEPGETGNVGTISDNISVKILGSDGRELT